MQTSVGYPELERRLWNWSDWQRTGQGTRRNRCGSAERNYRSSLYESQFTARCIDIEDAEVIERGLTRLPDLERALIVATYYLRERERAICRKLKLAWKGMAEWMLRVRAALCLLSIAVTKGTS